MRVFIYIHQLTSLLHSEAKRTPRYTGAIADEIFRALVETLYTPGLELVCCIDARAGSLMYMFGKVWHKGIGYQSLEMFHAKWSMRGGQKEKHAIEAFL